MQVTIDENSGAGSADVERFEELKLETGEVARLVVPVEGATAEYVHELKPDPHRQRRHPGGGQDTQGQDHLRGGGPPDSRAGRSAPGWWTSRPEDPEHPCPARCGPRASTRRTASSARRCVEQGIAEPEGRAALRRPRHPDHHPGQVQHRHPGPAEREDLRAAADLAAVPGLRHEPRRASASCSAGALRSRSGPTWPTSCIECEDGGFKRYKWLAPMRGALAEAARPGGGPEPGAARCHLRAVEEPGQPAHPGAAAGGLRQGRATSCSCSRTCSEVTDSYAMRPSASSAARPVATAPGRDRPGGGAGDLGAGLDGLDDIDAIIGGDSTPAAAAAPAASAAATRTAWTGWESSTSPRRPTRPRRTATPPSQPPPQPRLRPRTRSTGPLRPSPPRQDPGCRRCPAAAARRKASTRCGTSCNGRSPPSADTGRRGPGRRRW